MSSKVGRVGVMEPMDEKRKGKNLRGVAVGRLGGLVRSEANQRAKQRKWTQGRFGQKPQEENRCASQRATSASRSPEKLIEIIIAANSTRFGDSVIGRGDCGIRFVADRYFKRMS